MAPAVATAPAPKTVVHAGMGAIFHDAGVAFRVWAPNAKEVFVLGSFNDWKPTAQKMDGPDASGHYQTKLILAQGIHEYKYVLDGTRWRHDPGNPNNQGGGSYHNSVVEVGKVAVAGRGNPR